MNNRVKVFRISEDFFIELFTDGEHTNHYLVENGIPKDAIVKQIRQDYTWPGFCIMFQHPSFPEVENGSLLEVIVPVLTKLHK